MRKLSKRDKRALVILGVGGTVVLVVFGVILPFYDAKGQMENELEKKEELLGRYIQVIQEEEVYRAWLEDLDRVLVGYRQRLLDAQETGLATIQLEEVVRSLAAENDIRVTRSNPLQEREIGDNYVKVTLQINLQSDMLQLANFLYALSAHPKFFLVENFFLNSFRSREQVRIQPRMNVSGFIRLS
ncbi:type II secretion system protein GspM [Acidobacteria bacterium AH-259-D05]|nr:type II secretion system protein GspM [Acidobacteria bacterium AH-259-D05]